MSRQTLSRTDRVAQMTKQEELIAKKRQEIIEKQKTVELGRAVAAAQSDSANANPKTESTSTSEPSTTAFNITSVSSVVPPEIKARFQNNFCNDGSFLTHFKKILEERNISDQPSAVKVEETPEEIDAQTADNVTSETMESEITASETNLTLQSFHQPPPNMSYPPPPLSVSAMTGSIASLHHVSCPPPSITSQLPQVIGSASYANSSQPLSGTLSSSGSILPAPSPTIAIEPSSESNENVLIATSPSQFVGDSGTESVAVSLLPNDNTSQSTESTSPPLVTSSSNAADPLSPGGSALPVTGSILSTVGPIQSLSSLPLDAGDSTGSLPEVSEQSLPSAEKSPSLTDSTSSTSDSATLLAGPSTTIETSSQLKADQAPSASDPNPSLAGPPPPAGSPASVAGPLPPMAGPLPSSNGPPPSSGSASSIPGPLPSSGGAPTMPGPPSSMAGTLASTPASAPQVIGQSQTVVGPSKSMIGSSPSLARPPPLVSGPPPSMSGPPPSMSGPPPSMSGPPPSMSGPPPSMSGPPPSMAGPPPSMSGRLPSMTGPPPSMVGPPPHMFGPPPRLIGPPPQLIGPPPPVSGSHSSIASLQHSMSSSHSVAGPPPRHKYKMPNLPRLSGQSTPTFFNPHVAPMGAFSAITTPPPPPPPSTPLYLIPPPDPLQLNKIPPPKDLDLNAIPKPEMNVQTIKMPNEFQHHQQPPMSATPFQAPVQESSKDSNDQFLPTTLESLVELVAEKGDAYEDQIRSRKSDVHPSMWFLFDVESMAYKSYRNLVESHRIKSNYDENSVDVANKSDDPANKMFASSDEKYDPESVIENHEDSDDEYMKEMMDKNLSNLKRKIEDARADSDGSGEDSEQKQERSRKRKSRWGGKVSASETAITAVVQTNFGNQNKPMLSAIQRTDPALLQYARQNYGSTNLTEEDWRKCEDHFKINLLYQDMMRKREEIDQLAQSGKFKYEYDSDEDTAGGTWEHKLRTAEMEATQAWADALTAQSEGKHHIGDFLPPEELKKFMEKYDAKKCNRTPDLSDYKEYKLTEDNIGFQMLQKLGWKEGQGLGASGTGIVDPVNKAPQRDSNQGLGAATPSNPDDDDNEYEAYRKRMMLAYRFRPNPLNNPRRAYY